MRILITKWFELQTILKKKTPRSRYNETEKCISDKTFMNYENILFR